MNKLLSIIILLSLFLIQIHGIGHTDFDDHANGHSCAICDIQSHQSNIVPESIDFTFEAEYLINIIPLFFDDQFITESFKYKNICPRAPPIV